MSDAGGRPVAQQLAQAIGEVLLAGETACLATLVVAPPRGLPRAGA